MPHERISSRADLHRFQDADMRAYGLSRWTFAACMRDPVWRWQRAYRRVEWAVMCWPRAARPIAEVWRLWVRCRGIRLGFTIPLGVAGPGLCIVHWGTLVISAHARIGTNLRIHPGSSLGARKTGTPIVGDDCYIGPGARLVGPVVIGDRSRVGANAVVNRSCAPDSILVGVPARDVTRRDEDVAEQVRQASAT